MNMFSLAGKNAVVLGGAGVLGAAMSRGLAENGANVAVADLFEDQAIALAAELEKLGITARGYKVDAMSEDSLNQACDNIRRDFGVMDILVNAVGGNRKDATCSDTMSFFDVPSAALQSVISLNLFGGAILPSQVFGKCMSGNENGGSIINISSMNAFRPLTRIAGYSAAKAAVNNFTQWLAVYLAQNGCPKLRVNAVAPGFFLTQQNRFLLTDEKTGDFTPRGKSVIDHTPMGRFGDPSDLIGALVWLASDASSFVTGIVIPVDGGFSAYSGV